MAITTTGDAIFYTVPFLQQITRLHLFFGIEPWVTSVNNLSTC